MSVLVDDSRQQQQQWWDQLAASWEKTALRAFRQAARRLAKAKDHWYGWQWHNEVVAARRLAALGPVPAPLFEEVYQEVLAVYCGNCWGRSLARMELASMLDALDAADCYEILRLLRENGRVRAELHCEKPGAYALQLAQSLADRVSEQALAETLASIAALRQR